MSSQLVPDPKESETIPLPSDESQLPVVADSPFHRLVGLSRQDLAATRELSAAERRLMTACFVTTFTWTTVRPLLPFRLAIPVGVPAWQPRRCRSFYRWLPPDDLHTADDLEGLDDFDLILRLFDFSAWRPILGQRFTSQMGPPPFDPVSLGLADLLARWQDWPWSRLLTELRSAERGKGYCRRLGFDPADLPSESTFRMAVSNTETAWVKQWADSLALGLMAYGLIPPPLHLSRRPTGTGSEPGPGQPIGSRTLPDVLPVSEPALLPAEAGTDVCCTRGWPGRLCL